RERAGRAEGELVAVVGDDAAVDAGKRGAGHARTLRWRARTWGRDPSPGLASIGRSTWQYYATTGVPAEWPPCGRPRPGPGRPPPAGAAGRGHRRSTRRNRSRSAAPAPPPGFPPGTSVAGSVPRGARRPRPGPSPGTPAAGPRPGRSARTGGRAGSG